MHCLAGPALAAGAWTSRRAGRGAGSFLPPSLPRQGRTASRGPSQRRNRGERAGGRVVLGPRTRRGVAGSPPRGRRIGRGLRARPFGGAGGREGWDGVVRGIPPTQACGSQCRALPCACRPWVPSSCTKTRLCLCLTSVKCWGHESLSRPEF